MVLLRYLFYGVGLAILLINAGCNWPLDNPSDRWSSDYTVKSEASISVNTKGPYYQFDTVSFTGGVTSLPVEKAALVRKYEWDFGNNGKIDTVLGTPATFRVPVYRSGSYSVAIRLTDKAGYISEHVATIFVLPRFKLDIILPTLNAELPSLTIDSSCAYYTQNEYTMRPAALFGRYLTYRNKSESMSTGNFVFELLKNFTGTLDYNTLSLPYKKGFKNGVYTLGNDSLSMNAAFLYGPATAGHNENDTILHDLFNPLSYIKSFKVQLSKPYYSYEAGPLWDLTSGFNVDVSNPLSPKLTLKIALNGVKFCGYRDVKSRYTMSAEMVDSNQIKASVFDAVLFNYHGIARIVPFQITIINSLVQNDSLEIDMTGSTIASDSFPMTFTLGRGLDTTTVRYNFLLNQRMLSHKVRFGNKGGNRKIFGSYGAESQLSVDKLSLINSYFNGVFSTSLADTASFYCDREMTSQFGNLYFDTPQSGYFTFVSDRYSYRFTMRDGVIEK
jgi:hypothetical protein